MGFEETISKSRYFSSNRQALQPFLGIPGFAVKCARGLAADRRGRVGIVVGIAEGKGGSFGLKPKARKRSQSVHAVATREPCAAVPQAPQDTSDRPRPVPLAASCCHEQVCRQRDGDKLYVFRLREYAEHPVSDCHLDGGISR